MNLAKMISKAARMVLEPTNDHRPAGATEVEVDVREDLRKGLEPFSRIMRAVATLPAGQVLHLRAIFEPVPLFKVLEKQGFAHESEPHGPDDWSIWLWKRGAAAVAGVPVGAMSSPSAVEAHIAPADAPNAAETIWLDVRGLRPPEPLVRTLAALDALRKGQTLVQVHNRVPQLLFPLLAERGFACDVDERDLERVLVRIWRIK